MAVSASQIAQWLREQRERAGLSQTEAALRAGLSPDAISKWERGEKGIMAENFVALALAYGSDLTSMRNVAPHDYAEIVRAPDRRVAEPAPARPLAKNADAVAGSSARSRGVKGRKRA